MEKELVLKAKAGNRNAFEALVRLYLPKLHKAAYFFLFNIEDAADICQEVFLKAYSNFYNFDDKRPFYPWIYTILKNLCINHKKRAQKIKASEQNVDTVTSNYAGPEEEVFKKDDTQRLVKAFSALPEMHREILVLKVYNNLSYEGISRMLDIPKGTVMSRLYNARVKLRDILNGMEE